MTWRRWGDGPALVLIHGGFGSWRHWVRNIGPLSARFSVWACDLPGLGDSAPAPRPHTAERLASVLGEGIDTLLGEGATFSIGAFSLGAVIAAPLIASRREQLRHGALIGASGLGPYWRNAVAHSRRWSAAADDAEKRAVVRENLASSMIADPDGIDDDTVALQLELLRQRRQLIGLPISQSSVLLDRLDAIFDKVTLIWGEHDPSLAPDRDSAMAALRQRCPGISIRLVAGAGHWANHEMPREVEAILESHV